MCIRDSLDSLSVSIPSPLPPSPPVVLLAHAYMQAPSPSLPPSSCPSSCPSSVLSKLSVTCAVTTGRAPPPLPPPHTVSDAAGGFRGLWVDKKQGWKP
eukprot:2686364-Rhodomonas_salina.1